MSQFDDILVDFENKAKESIYQTLSLLASQIEKVFNNSHEIGIIGLVIDEASYNREHRDIKLIFNKSKNNTDLTKAEVFTYYDPKNYQNYIQTLHENEEVNQIFDEIFEFLIIRHTHLYNIFLDWADKNNFTYIYLNKNDFNLKTFFNTEFVIHYEKEALDNKIVNVDDKSNKNKAKL